MATTIGWSIGGLFMAVGMLYMTGKKWIVPKWLDNLMILAVCAAYPFLLLRNGTFGLPWAGGIALLGLVILAAVFGWFSLGKFTVVNLRAQAFATALLEQLTAMGIPAEAGEQRVFLPEHGDREIVYRQYTNTVEADLRSIRSLPIYSELATGLKQRLRASAEKVFPAAGVFYFLLGLAFLLAMLWVAGRPCPFQV